MRSVSFLWPQKHNLEGYQVLQGLPESRAKISNQQRPWIMHDLHRAADRLRRSRVSRCSSHLDNICIATLTMIRDHDAVNFVLYRQSNILWTCDTFEPYLQLGL
jgi:hypothetical protein